MEYDLENPSLYSETQRFNQLWMIAIIFIPLVIFSLIFIKQFLFGFAGGSSKTIPLNVLLIMIAVGIGEPLLIFSCKLVTEVRTDGVYVKFFPFMLSFRKIPKEEIESYQARIYKPVQEYGGWGIKGFKSNRAYNVSGNEGMQLVLKNKDRILIGTKNPDEFQLAMAQIMHKKEM
ncbi:MAG: hypothetical protein JXA60_07400 [Candidatus Coatesbacteria bacterium]|nr:hypothetical protein [Candidatus Coatesbacteria bacterium]